MANRRKGRSRPNAPADQELPHDVQRQRDKSLIETESSAREVEGASGNADGALKSSVGPPERPPETIGDRFAEAIGKLTATGIKAAIASLKTRAVSFLQSLAGMFLAGTTLGAVFGFGGSYVPTMFRKEHTFIGIARGLSSESCKNGPPADLDSFLANKSNYTTQRHIWTISFKGNKFSGTQSVSVKGNQDLPVDGSSVIGKNLVGFQRGNDTFGSYFLSVGSSDYLVGTQTGPDCAAHVNLSCPYVLGPAVSEDGMKNNVQITDGICQRVVPAQPNQTKSP